MSKKVADQFVEMLEAAGVQMYYGIVGDMVNQIARIIDRSENDFVQVRHEEASAIAAGAGASLTVDLTACAGSRGPGSLHFINGLYEANCNLYSSIWNDTNANVHAEMMRAETLSLAEMSKC